MRTIVLATAFCLLPALASATADGPDYWEVTGIAEGEELAIHVAADVESAVVGQIPAGSDGLMNIGCNTGFANYEEWERATPEERTAAREAAWCRIGFKDRIGWVRAKNLSEGGPAPHSHDHGEDALEGDPWLLVDLAGKVPGAKATAIFGEGTVQGNGGCNTYSANVTTEEDGLRIGPILTTRMRCLTEGAEGTMTADETERGFLAALAETRSILQGGDVAALFDDEDRLLATLQRAAE